MPKTTNTKAVDTQNSKILRASSNLRELLLSNGYKIATHNIGRTRFTATRDEVSFLVTIKK